MVLMVYTAVDQVLVVNPCGAEWFTLCRSVLVVNPCGAGLHWFTLVVLYSGTGG